MSPLVSMALRNVLRNRRRTLITLAALTVGVTAVGTIRGILNGLQDTIVKSSIEAQLGALQVHRAGYLANVLSTPLTLDFPFDDALVQKVKSVRGVTGVAPRIQFGGSLTIATDNPDDTPEAVFFAATAVDPTLEPTVTPRRAQLNTEGTVFDDEHAVLGDSLAEAFGAKPGTELIMLAPDREGSLNGELTHMGGAMHRIMPGEMKVALVPLATAQKLLRMEGRVTELGVAVDDLTHVAHVAEDLRHALGPGFEVHGWADLAPERATIMNVQTGVASVISFVFLMLMLLGVANTMLMSVLERTREVGTMMAVGLTRRSVMVLFLLEALVLGVLGAALGFTLTALLTFALSRHGIRFTPPNATMPLDVFPFLTVQYTALALATAIGGAVLFALYPAWRASRLRPVEALSGH